MAEMKTVFKFAYQLWHTMTKEDIAEQVKIGSLAEKDYREIVGEEYPSEVAE